MGATEAAQLAIQISIEADQAEKGLAALPGQANKAAQDMAKAMFKGTERTKEQTAGLSKRLKELRKEFDDSTKSGRSFGDMAGDVGSRAKKLSGLLDMIVPGLGDVTRGIDDLADGGEVASDVSEALGVSMGTMGVAVGALALAVGGAYVAWRYYNEDAQRAAEITDMVTAAHDRLQPILDNTAESTILLAVATGSLSEMEGRRAINAARAQKAYQEATKETRAQLEAVGEEMGSAKTKLVDFTQQMLAGTGIGIVFARGLDGVTTDSAELQEKSDKLAASLEEGWHAMDENVAVTDKLIRTQEAAKRALEAKRKAEERAREEAEAHAAALRILEVATQHAADVNEEYAQVVSDAYADFRQETERTTAAALDGEERIRAELALTIGEINRKAQAAQDAAVAMGAAADVGVGLEEAAQQDRVAQVAKAEAEIARIRAAADAKALADAEKTQDQLANAVADSVGSVLSAVDSAVADAADNQADLLRRLETDLDNQGEHRSRSEQLRLERRVRAQQQAALEAFNVQKGAAMVTAAINTAVAISEANASAPYPYNIPAIIGATATGMAEELAIASSTPSFGDTPGVMQMDQGGVVRLARDDYFAAAQTPQDLRDQVGSPEVRVVAETHYRHQSFDRFVVDNLKRNGPLPQAMRGTTKVGHRSNR